MNNRSLMVTVATLGPIGYLRGSGTWASLVTLPVVAFLCTTTVWLQIAVVALVACAMSLCVYSALSRFEEGDPSAIVADEIVGMMVTMIGIPCSLPTILLGFVLFRLFDIFKPLGISFFEKLHGWGGVMADDIVAGCLANLILRVIYAYA